MRCTQDFGLSPDALDFLESNAIREPLHVCQTCSHKTGGQIINRVYGSARSYGMFDDGPNLYEYTLEDGRIVREIVQDCPWSSGPCIFLCLEDDKGKRIGEWDQDVIDNC